MASREFDLGNAELEVLRALWDQGPGTVRDLWNHLRQRGRRWAYTTVQTLLTRLEQKGFVTCDKSAQAFVYRASLTRRRVSRSRIRAIVEQLYDGAAGPLALQLIKTQKFTAEEIAALHDLIDGLDSEPNRPTQ